MRFSPWPVTALLAAALVGLMPAQSQLAQAAESDVIVVDSQEGPLPELLSPDELATLDQLQQPQALTLPLSPISPDDAVALGVSNDTLGFLSVADGTLQPIDPSRFSRYVPLPLLGISPFVWRDERTLASLALDLEAQEIGQLFALVTIDRSSGEISGDALGLGENDVPIDLTADLAKVLVLSNIQSEASPASASLAVSWPRTAQPGALGLPAWLQATAQAALERAPALALAPTRGADQSLLQADRSILQASTQTLALSVLDVASKGRTEILTTAPGTIFAGTAWSPDGSKLAVSLLGLFDEGNSRVFDGALLSEQVYADVTGQLPPEQNPFLQNNTVELFDLASGGQNTLRAADGDGPLLLANGWSPDSKALLVAALHPGRVAGREFPIYTPQFADRVSFRFYDAALQETGRLESIELSSPAGASASFVGPDELLLTGIVGTDLRPYYYNRATGEFRDIADRAGIFARIVATSQRSRQLLYLHTSFTEPVELWRMNWDGSGVARLSWNNYEVEQFSQTRQDPVAFTLQNGEVRSGVLIQPKGASYPPSDVPLIVWQEGGPGVPMVSQWLTNVENPYALLPNYGFALLVVPAAGRPGYGSAVYDALADNDNFGQVDIDEIAEVSRQAIARGWTTPSKLGITGCSYGGYFTWQSVIRHPDLYAAANPQCAFIDLITEWSRGFDRLVPYLQGDTPFENPAEYQRDSPIYNVAAVKAAVLSFHGTDDFLPITQNENIHLQLVAQDVPARMLKFAGAGHGLGSQEYQRYAAQEQIQWFRTYLK